METKQQPIARLSATRARLPRELLGIVGEVLIHNTWLLVTGWATDQQHPKEQQQSAQVRASLAESLPS